MKRLILASGSSGRRALLDSLGFPYTVEPSNYEEDMSLAMAPQELAIFLSRGKARDVAAKHKNAVVLGADSFGVMGSRLFGKPHTLAKAKEMLSVLSGRQHLFITGFTVIDCDSGKEYSEAVESKVYFKKLSPAEISSYLAKEDVLEKAGAYTPGGLGGILVEKIEGNINNVVSGLPLSHVAPALKKFGINLL